jgi:hypothetical protein
LVSSPAVLSPTLLTPPPTASTIHPGELNGFLKKKERKAAPALKRKLIFVALCKNS